MEINPIRNAGQTPKAQSPKKLSGLIAPDAATTGSNVDKQIPVALPSRIDEYAATGKTAPDVFREDAVNMAKSATKFVKSLKALRPAFSDGIPIKADGVS